MLIARCEPFGESLDTPTRQACQHLRPSDAARPQTPSPVYLGAILAEAHRHALLEITRHTAAEYAELKPNLGRWTACPRQTLASRCKSSRGGRDIGGPSVSALDLPSLRPFADTQTRLGAANGCIGRIRLFVHRARFHRLIVSDWRARGLDNERIPCSAKFTLEL
jgi:hypothetical protein